MPTDPQATPAETLDLDAEAELAQRHPELWTLVLEARETAFNCGEWDNEAEVSLEVMGERSDAARRALASALLARLAARPDEEGAREVERMLDKATVRLGILRDRMAACDESLNNVGPAGQGHALSHFEIAGWIEEQRAVLGAACPDEKGTRDRHDAAAEARIYRQALEDIVNPVAALRRYAEQNDGVLNGGYAVQLAESASHLQDIAARALAATPSLSAREREGA